MFVDNTLSFNTNWSTTQTITTTADSASVIDITGAGSGNAPAMINGFPAATIIKKRSIRAPATARANCANGGIVKIIGVGRARVNRTFIIIGIERQEREYD